MGGSYSIDLFFELDRLEDALTVAAEFAARGDESTEIALPSGRELMLPFSRPSTWLPSEDEERIVRSGEAGIHLDAVLNFPVDPEIESMQRWMGFSIEDDYAELYLLLWVHAGWRFVELSFHSQHSLMDCLIINSTSVHQRFLELLRRAGGIAGIINVPGHEKDHLLLSDPNRALDLDRQDFLDPDFDLYEGGTDYDVDGFTTALVAECDRLRGQAEGLPS